MPQSIESEAVKDPVGSSTAPGPALPSPHVRVATAAEMRDLDRRTIEELGLPGLVLMERAALGVVDVLRRTHPELLSSRRKAVILAGSGNNGGDGLAIARLLHNLGKPVEVVLFGELKRRTSENHAQAAMLGALNLPLQNADSVNAQELLTDGDLIVDALFGIGLTTALDKHFVELFTSLNEQRNGLVVAVDIPSGLDADRGHSWGAALRADLSVTVGWPKTGLLMDQAADLVGRLWLVDIGIPGEFSRGLPGALLDRSAAAQLLPPPRRKHSHKGTYGTLLGVAGARTMSGAARLMAGAALRTGIGLLYLAVPESVQPVVAAACPEAMVVPLPETADGTISSQALEVLKSYFPRADALVLGPGMGRSADGAQLVTSLLAAYDKPIVLDADGLNNLSNPGQILSWRASSETVLTPHPGELGRMMGTSASLVQQDRLAAATKTAREYAATVVLKGARTIVAHPDGHYWINASGNPLLAVGGSGDVLAGLIAGFLAQGLGSQPAALLGTYVHGLAADLAALSRPGWSLLPTELIAELSGAVEVLLQPAPLPVHAPLQLI